MVHDLQNTIINLKKQYDFAILAHSYQSPEILEIADLTGDSFVLSAKAAALPQKNVLLCGVRFMAETVKILAPEKRVVLPVPQATCPMAEQISPEQVLAFKAENPGVPVVAYINTTAALKAVCDVCVTSSSALKVVSALPGDRLLFLPDKNLGHYLQTQLPHKEIILWNGFCPVHNAVTEEECLAAKAMWPDAKFLMHPELPREVVQYADVVGSTAAILDAAKKADGPVVIGTEKTIVDQLKLSHPHGTFHLLSKKLLCPDMRITTLADVLAALQGTGGEVIELEEDLRLSAKRPIDEMLRLG